MSALEEIVSYFELIERKFEEGSINYDKYTFYTDKLTQWYYVSNKENNKEGV